MSKSRLEWKVGVFVFIGLVLLAGLLLEFSKGLTFFSETHIVNLRAENVNGLKLHAGVLMSGVQVGTVSGIQLDPDGRHVTIALQIYNRYEIHKDAVFSIETSGFLGDQYVSILPTENKAPLFLPGETATAEEPFNLQAAARAALGFINHLDETAKKLDAAIVDIRASVLNQETLTNLAASAANLRSASGRAAAAIDRIDALLATNAPALEQSATNLVAFSKQLTQTASALDALLATNSPGISASVKNIESSTAALQNLVGDVQAGKGLAGTLLKNDQISKDLSDVVHNLSVTTSNLNRNGIWGILWRQKVPRTNETSSAASLLSPKERNP